MRKSPPQFAHSDNCFSGDSVAGKIHQVSARKADYYEILGVARDADADAIRKAFHAAAWKLHPDVSSEPGSGSRFRELAEAYSVLSKPAARLLYDRFGYRGHGNSGFNEDIWNAREEGPRGQNVHLDVTLRPFEAEAGARRVVAYSVSAACPECDGRGTAGPPDPDCVQCGGTGRKRQVALSDVGRFLHIEACPACTGGVCAACSGSGTSIVDRVLRVRIPPGIDDGAQVRVAGEGHAADDALPGDLVLDVNVLAPPRDRAVVRYAALALFLAAVVILIAYLLFR